MSPEFDEELLGHLLSDLKRPDDPRAAQCRQWFAGFAREILAEARAGRGVLIGGSVRRPHTKELRAELRDQALKYRENLREVRSELAERGESHLFAEFQCELLRLYRRFKGILIVQEAALDRAMMWADSEILAKYGVSESGKHGPM